MNSPRLIAITFGTFFILTFLSYGAGSSMIDVIVSVPDTLSNVHSNKNQLVIAVILIALIHTFFNIALPVVVFPIIKPYNAYLAYGYLSAAIVATVILTVGALFLLLMIPLSDGYVSAGSGKIASFEVMAKLLIDAGFYAYHIGMSFWALGGLMFVAILYQSKLIPRVMSAWGIVGYILLISGAISELFEHNEMVEIYSVVLGGLFEISLSIRLIVKGFDGIKYETKLIQ